MGNTLYTYNWERDQTTKSLANQTFKIQGQSYTFIKRLGGGGFGSVWSATTPNGRPAAVKTIDVSGQTGRSNLNAHTLIESFQKEIKMAYKMRQETRHVVTIYGFDFDPRSGLALMAMELGGDTLAQRIAKLHSMRDMQRRYHRHDFSRAVSNDYISARDRKNIWTQLVNIVQTLHRHRVVRVCYCISNIDFFVFILDSS